MYGKCGDIWEAVKDGDATALYSILSSSSRLIQATWPIKEEHNDKIHKNTHVKQTDRENTKAALSNKHCS